MSIPRAQARGNRCYDSKEYAPGQHGQEVRFPDRQLLPGARSRQPESPLRLRAVQAAIAAHETVERWQRLQPRPASREELELVHRPGLIERVEKAARRAPAYLDPDTVVSSRSYHTAL